MVLPIKDTYDQVSSYMRDLADDPSRIEWVVVEDSFALAANITRKETIRTHLSRMERLGYIQENQDGTYAVK